MRIDGFLVRLGSGSCLILGLFRGPGCGSSESTTFDDGPSAPSNGDPGQEHGFESPPTSSDAGAPASVAYQGNPLCRVDPGAECFPDDDGSRVRTRTCSATPLPDGGVTPSERACRLVRDGDVSPRCLESSDAAGTDGVACSTGQDCAPGFDCVEGDKGQVCRRYCCAESCDGKTSQSGGKTFCDVQKLVDSSAKAPVCMPLKTCKLLTPGQCAANETCAVVTDSGDTGCVEVGQAQVNDSCDAEHCAAGLTCIGQPGARRCYQLCKVDGNEACPASLVCKTTTSFREPQYGICQKPTSMD